MRILIGALLFAATSSAAAAPSTAIRARDTLTAHQTLRGTMSFATPPGWREEARSGAYTARFSANDGAGCEVALTASIRGKATRQSAAEQAAAIGIAVAEGRRAGGAYRMSAIVPAGRRTLYGIAVVRVEPRRFGQLRVFADFTGAGCTDEAFQEGSVARQITRILRRAQSRLRVSRSR